MIKLEEFKASLGDKVDELTEEQIIKLKDQMEQMAELLFDSWLKDMRNK